MASPEEYIDTLAKAGKCPDCGAGIWDNREKNKEREKAGEKLFPELSCKNKCGWTKWRPRPQGGGSGGGFKGKRGSPDAPLMSDEALEALYKGSLRFAWDMCKASNGAKDPAFVFTASDVKEMTAAIFIQKCKARGM